MALGSIATTEAGCVPGYSSQIYLTSCYFEECYADDGGGAVVFSYGTIAVVDSTFANCSTAGSGGALYLLAPDAASVQDSTFRRCSAGDGGGAIMVVSPAAIPPLRVTRTLFDGNRAHGPGDAVLNQVSVTVTSSTFEGNGGDNNAVFVQGAGAAFVGDSLTFTNHTGYVVRAGNSASASITNSIFADCDINLCVTAGFASSVTVQCSLLPGDFGLPEDNNLAVYDPNLGLLGPLADNGGPTLTRWDRAPPPVAWGTRLLPCSLARIMRTTCIRAPTHACARAGRLFRLPLPGSPAIDSGDASLLDAANKADQRGRARVVGSGPDLGAVEGAWGSGPTGHIMSLACGMGRQASPAPECAAACAPCNPHPA